MELVQQETRHCKNSDIPQTKMVQQKGNQPQKK